MRKIIVCFILSVIMSVANVFGYTDQFDVTDVSNVEFTFDTGGNNTRIVEIPIKKAKYTDARVTCKNVVTDNGNTFTFVCYASDGSVIEKKSLSNVQVVQKTIKDTGEFYSYIIKDDTHTYHFYIFDHSNSLNTQYVCGFDAKIVSTELPVIDGINNTAHIATYAPRTTHNNTYAVGGMQCKAITQKGTRCKRNATKNGYCWQHGGNA